MPNGNIKRGEGGLIKMKKQVELKSILGDLKHFSIKGAGWLGLDP